MGEGRSPYPHLQGKFSGEIVSIPAPAHVEDIENVSALVRFAVIPQELAERAVLDTHILRPYRWARPLPRPGKPVAAHR